MIRNLSKQDFSEYYRVRLKALEKYPLAYSSMPKFFKEATQEMHDNLLHDSGSDSSFFVKGYFENKKLIGIIGLKPELRESIAHKASLWGYYVDTKFQRKGIGQKLLDSLLNDATNDQKIKFVRLVVCKTCENAISLFHKAGFIDYGVERESISDGRTFYDQVYMQNFVPGYF